MSTVVQLDRYFETEVANQIERFLRIHKNSSVSTYESYKRDIINFFRKTRKTKITHLKKQDLKFTIDEFEDYYYYLLNNKGLAASTVNRQLSSISECFKHLNSRGLVKDISFINIRKVKAEGESYDHLTRDEIYRAADYVSKQGRKYTGQVKKRLMIFGFDTCMRLEEMLNLKWSDFTVVDEEITVVESTQKGSKKIRRKIRTEHYNELLEIKKDGCDKVFNIGSATVERMVPDIRNFLNIDPENRWIVFHSIRKGGAQYIWEKTRDINQARKRLGHESIRTTELYIDKDEEYSVLGGHSDTFVADIHLYREVEYDKLIKAIDLLEEDKKTFINLKLKELME